MQIIDSGFEAAGIPYSYGFSIIALTLLVKLLTFPLSKQQVKQFKTIFVVV
jgi:YidC/Oxa1 family membrane protein insertase